MRRGVPQRVDRTGFTLIELLVALAILAIVLSSIYATFFSTIRAMRDSREKDDTYQVARVVMERITNDLAMAFYRTDNTRVNHPTLAFIGRNDADNDYARDRVDFTTASNVLLHDGNPERDIVEVSYYIDDTYTDRPVLVRRYDRLPEPEQDFRHGGALRVLAEDVVALDFRYRERGPEASQLARSKTVKKEDTDAEEPEWHDAWNAEKYKSLPELVEVTMTIRDAEGEEHEFGSQVLLNPYQVWRQ